MTIPFIRIYEVESVDDTTLVLLNGTLRETFRRAPDDERATEAEQAPDGAESQTTLDMLEKP